MKQRRSGRRERNGRRGSRSEEMEGEGLITLLAHPLAIAHNDKSVLENYHCAEAFKLLYQPSHDFLLNLSLAEYPSLSSSSLPVSSF